MIPGKYGCHQCKAVFEVRLEPGAGVATEVKCPYCCSIDIEMLPLWIPVGYSLDLYFGLSNWKYTCHQCKSEFELPVASSVTEEKQRTCPTCGSTDIERMATPEFQPPLYCS